MLDFFSSMKFGIILMILIIVISIISTLIPTTSTLYTFILTLPKLMMIILFFSLVFCTFRRLPSIWKTVKQDSNKVNLLAPHILHIGLAIVLVGALLGSFFGGEKEIVAQMGETVPLSAPLAQNISLQVNGFETIYDEQGDIDNWQTEITLIVDKKEAIHGQTMVNKPFKYKGLVFYQTAYGLLHNIIIEPKNHPSIVTKIENRTLDKRTSILLGDVYLFDQCKKGISISRLDDTDNPYKVYIKEGESMDFPKGTLTYLNSEAYTVLTAKRDPGTLIVMLGFLFMAVSSIFFWWGRKKADRGN